MKWIAMIAVLGWFAVNQAHAVIWSIHGAVKNETAYFISGNKGLDKVQNRLDLKPELVLSDRWEFRGRFLTWYDAAMDLQASNASTLTPSIKNYYRTFSEVKEAYFLYAGDDFDFRLGQQQIVWGKTDGLRLLDIVNPLNIREFLLDDFLDSRTGVVAARLNYYAYLDGHEHEFEFLVIPDAKVTQFAPLGSRWAYQAPLSPQGVVPVIQADNKPNWAAKNTEYGAAWRSNMQGWDVSLNWFYGWKDNPLLDKALSQGRLLIIPRYQQMHTLGGSFSNAFDAIVLRAEVAVNMDEAVTTSTRIAHTTTWNAALGLDYNQNNWRISPQFFIRYLQQRARQVLEKRSSGFVSLMLSTDYMNEKLKPEMIILVNWSDGSSMIRPKIAYEFNDQITTRLGVDLFTGHNTAFFGQFDQNDRVYSELEYSF
ncbi:MAG: hypothetical protein Q9M15_05610 [Mariprofundaceae bacterium]|nr:hypothetical protein [Mariprofundaceae bacterium]